MLAVVVLIVAIGVGGLLWSSLPRHDGERLVDGLSGPVTIRRDAQAIPYIEAGSEADGYFALGWVHAQDRLWQLELRRRIGAGRLAELIGAGGLGVDRFMRLMRFYDHAEASLDKLTPRARGLVDAYTAGINAYLAQPDGPLPPEFWLLWHRPEPWAATDSVVWARLMAFDLAGNWRRELLRARLAAAVTPERYDELFPGHAPTEPVTLARLTKNLEDFDLAALSAALPPAPPPGHGSNGWVVSGEHTATGAPLLANDPHLKLTMPGTWYLAGLKTPELEVVGATLPGLPAFVLGRTDRTAWGMTNTSSDVQDLVVESLVAEGGPATRTPDGTAPLVIENDLIRCRGCADETLRVRWSVNGPLISDLVPSARPSGGDQRAMALRWTALSDDDHAIEAGLGLPLAQDWPAFVSTLERFRNPQQNVFYADTDGQIGLIVPGAVPIRRSGDGTLPTEGWQAASEWVGFVPFDELPRAVDPPAGWVANANNAVVDETYPYLLSRRWDDPYRMARIVEQLPDRQHDVASFRTLQNDERSGLAVDLLPLMLTAETQRGDARAWLGRLRGWDRMVDAASTEATVFATWYRTFGEALYADELGPLYDAYRGQRAGFTKRALTDRGHWCDDVGTEAVVETCPALLGRSLEAALDQLRSAIGPDDAGWQWGVQHPATLQHDLFGRLGPLAAFGDRNWPIGGDDTTLRAASPSRSPTPPLFPSDHGVSYRQIVDLGTPANSRFVAATGQVGHPLSRHYDDLSAVWRAGEDVRMAAPSTPTNVQILQPNPTSR
ncbi:MAG: penicillin acylase family protein [Pseudomonadota bacterium]